MEGNIQSMLEDEIKSEFEKLKGLTPGSKEHTAAVEALATLYKLNIEETESDRAFREKCDQEIARDKELQLKAAQLAEQVKDRYFRTGIEGGSLVLMLIFNAVWMHRGFKFEETGTYTSTTFRTLFNRFRLGR